MAVASSLDTHALIRELTTGTGKVSESTAEKLVTAIKSVQDSSRSDLVTKADLKAEVATLRGELETMRAELKGDMQSLFWKLAAVFIVANAAMRYFPAGHL